MVFVMTEDVPSQKQRLHDGRELGLRRFEMDDADAAREACRLDHKSRC
jgi:hypothetical protein